MKLRKTLCFLLAMIMAFAIAFPGSIFAEEYFPEEELVFEEESSFSDNWIEEELIDELTSSDIVDDYYEDWIEDEFVDYDQPSLNEEVELVEEDEVLLEEPTEEDDNEVPDTEDTEVIGELVLVDNETFEAASSINITKQPKDVTAKLGEYATVSVTAEGDDLTYQWYYKAAGTSEFKASSAKTNLYRIRMTTQWDGMQVYCEIKSGSETLNTNVATISLANIVSGDFVFQRIDGTNNLTLIEYKGSASSITIPGTVEGMTVTEIGVSPLASGEKGVFEGNTTLTSVKLPNTITAIREKSFKGCTNLSTMTTY